MCRLSCFLTEKEKTNKELVELEREKVALKKTKDYNNGEDAESDRKKQ